MSEIRKLIFEVNQTMKKGDIVAWSLVNGWSLVRPNGYFPKWSEVTAYWRIKSIKYHSEPISRDTWEHT